MPKSASTDKVGLYTQSRDAWKIYDPAKLLYGQTQEQFADRINSYLKRIDRVNELETLLDGARNDRDTEGREIETMMPLLRSAIIADPDHGPDSSLYEAFGGVRKSERRSGLTRKRKPASGETPQGS